MIGYVRPLELFGSTRKKEEKNKDCLNCWLPAALRVSSGAGNKFVLSESLQNGLTDWLPCHSGFSVRVRIGIGQDTFHSVVTKSSLSGKMGKRLLVSFFSTDSRDGDGGWVMVDGSGFDQEIICKNIPQCLFSQLCHLYQQNMEIVSLSMGSCGEWFLEANKILTPACIGEEDGQHLIWSHTNIANSKEFSEILQRSDHVDKVLFGGDGGWLICHDKDCFEWYNLPARLDERLHEIISNDKIKYVIREISICGFRWLVTALNKKTGERMVWSEGVMNNEEFSLHSGKFWDFSCSLATQEQGGFIIQDSHRIVTSSQGLDPFILSRFN